MPTIGTRSPSLLLALGVAWGLSLTLIVPAAELPHKSVKPLKTIIKSGVTITEETPKAADKPPSATMSLSAYLQQQLGSKRFHKRSEWAGKSDKYKPVLTGGRVWKSIGTVSHITVHHSAGIDNEHAAAMIRNIYAGHVSENGPLDGAADVGYHFFVDRSGHIWEGRDATKVGSHVGSTPPGRNNPGNIGICGLGTFMDENPSKAMSDAFIEVCTLIAKYHGRALDVRGHKDWKGINQFAVNKQVDCPGKLESVVEKARKQVRIAMGVDGEAPTTAVASAEEVKDSDRIVLASSAGR